VKQALKGHGFGATSLSWQPGGELLASSGQDGKVRLWNTAAGNEAAVLAGGTAWVERVVWSPHGNMFISAAGKKLRLWNDTGDLIRAYPDQTATVADVKWSSKGKEFAAAGYGGVAFFNTEDDEPRARFNWKGSVLAIAWSPDGKFIAGGGQDASVHFWYVKDGKDLEMTGYPQKVRELSWDVSSTYLATGGGDLVTVWNCTGKGPAGSTPISLAFHEAALSVLAFQNRGPLLASACSGGMLAFWFPGGPKRVLSHTKLDVGISQLAWAPNDARIAVGGEAGYLGVWTI
jgi:WD40 repeat protein